jgi:hypothetical protein
MARSERTPSVRGFIAACWHFRNQIVWSWDFGAAIAVGVLLWMIPTDDQISKASAGIAGAAIALGATLVGVVIAALAVVVALLDDELLELMERDTETGGVEGHLFPYWFVTGTGVVAFLLGMTLLLVEPYIPDQGVRALFALVAAFVVYTSIGVFNIVASLQATGVTRALLAKGRRPK